MDYSTKIYKRKITDDIIQYLDERETIIIYGARQTGKTSVLYWLRDYLSQKNKPVFYFDLENIKYLDLFNQGPEKIRSLLIERGIDIKEIKGKIYILIDEIQYLDNPTNFIKLISDHYPQFRLIVSGSSTLEIKKQFRESLVGRTITFELFGLDFEEFLIFKEYHSPLFPIKTEIKINELADLFKEFVLFGGYPRVAQIKERKKKERYLWQIISTYLKKDIRDIAQVRNVDKFNKLVEVLASQSGKMLNIKEISNTCGLSIPTVEDYLFYLENTFIIRLVRPFARNLRSELFKTPKIYFYDSGLANLLWLKVIPEEILGEIFETAIFSELVKNFGRESIFYWRTKDKKEIDFILRRGNLVLPIEAKINFSSFSPKNIEFFVRKYCLKKFYCLGLRGEKKSKKCIYPWEIFGEKFFSGD